MMMHLVSQYRSITQAVLISLAFAFVLSGCSIQLVSKYDENTDKAVTKLQKDFESFFVTVDSQAGLPECKYDNHKKFYQNSKVAISAIDVRARALAKNEITVEQVGLLKDSLGSLEKLHKLGCFTNSQVENLRGSFNSSITAILKLELAKKRGE